MNLLRMKTLLLPFCALAVLAASAMKVSVTPGTAVPSDDGTWLCKVSPDKGFVWVDFVGLPDAAEATGWTFDYYAADFSVLNSGFAFLVDSVGGCTRWKEAAPTEEGVWNRITVLRDDPNATAFAPDNSDYIQNKADWSKAVRFRFMMQRQSPRATEFRIGHLRPILPAKARPGVPGERRFAFARVTALSERCDWEETAAFLEKIGFTDLYACVARGGHAYYDSKFLPRCPTLPAGRDSVRECVAACRRHGIRFHAGKANWNCEHEDTPKAFLEQMRREGRFQMTDKGAECRWLCPADPRNQELEFNVMQELADLGAEGIHFDYCRFRDGDCCYCARCLKRLSEKVGRVLSAPAEVKADKALHDEWIRLRVADIDRLVERVATCAHARSPRIEVSASTGRTPDMGLLGRAQDWPSWCRHGWLDVVSPMNYYISDVVYRHILEQQIRHLKGTKAKLVPYIGIGCSRYARMPEDTFLRELDAVRSHGLAGFAIFALDPYAEELLPRHFGRLRQKSPQSLQGELQ